MRSKITTNLSLKVLSLLSAIVLWFVVLGSRNVEITKEVPVEIITASDLVIANEIPDKVAFRLAGPHAFLRNILNRKEDPIRVNLSNAKAGLSTYRFFSDNIQIPIGVKVLLINPTAIVVKLETLKKKELPVKLITHGEAPSGYKIERLELLKTSVRIKGAESKVDTLTEVQTVPLDISQIHDSGEREVAIDTSHLGGVLIDGDLPRVRFTVMHETANFKIRNVNIKVLTDRRYELTPNEVSLYVRCNPEDLKNLDRSKVFAIADLRNRGAGTYEIGLTLQAPGAIKIVKVVPSKIKVHLK